MSPAGHIDLSISSMDDSKQMDPQKIWLKNLPKKELNIGHT